MHQTAINTKRFRAFTMVELLIVATIMVMVAGIIYTFYINLARVYYRGSKTLLAVLDAQTTLEKLAREVRSAARLIALKDDQLTFQRYYHERDPNKEDPVADLNKLRVKTVDIRLIKDGKGYYRFERRENSGSFEPYTKFRAKNLEPKIFRGWKLVKNQYVVYDHNRSQPTRVPILQIRMHIPDERNPIDLSKKVFLPAPYGQLPVIKLPEWIKKR